MSLSGAGLACVCLLVVFEAVLSEVITRDDPRFCELCCKSKRQQKRYRKYACPGCDRCVLEDLDESATEGSKSPRPQVNSAGRRRNSTSTTRRQNQGEATTSRPRSNSRPPRGNRRRRTTPMPRTTTPEQNCPAVIQIPDTCCAYVEQLPACFCRYCPGQTKRLVPV